jgi:hypothetical protein
VCELLTVRDGGGRIDVESLAMAIADPTVDALTTLLNDAGASPR